MKIWNVDNSGLCLSQLWTVFYYNGENATVSHFMPVFACLHVAICVSACWVGSRVLWIIHEVVKMTLRQWESSFSPISDSVSSSLCQALYHWWETRGHVAQPGILKEKISRARLLEKRPVELLTQSCFTYHRSSGSCFLDIQKLHWRTLVESMDRLTLTSSKA